MNLEKFWNNINILFELLLYIETGVHIEYGDSISKSKKIKLSQQNRPWKHIGLWDVKDPTLSRQSARS
jgi:hypothetical protein